MWCSPPSPNLVGEGSKAWRSHCVFTLKRGWPPEPRASLRGGASESHLGPVWATLGPLLLSPCSETPAERPPPVPVPEDWPTVPSSGPCPVSGPSGALGSRRCRSPWRLQRHTQEGSDLAPRPLSLTRTRLPSGSAPLHSPLTGQAGGRHGHIRPGRRGALVSAGSRRSAGWDSAAGRLLGPLRSHRCQRPRPDAPCVRH